MRSQGPRGDTRQTHVASRIKMALTAHLAIPPRDDVVDEAVGEVPRLGQFQHVLAQRRGAVDVEVEDEVAKGSFEEDRHDAHRQRQRQRGRGLERVLPDNPSLGDGLGLTEL